MIPLHAAILGIVEGITEYLPISSTFHLIWTSHLLGLSQTEFQKTFEIAIQGGAILAVVALYFTTILKSKTLYKNIFLSFIPTGAIGFILYKVIKGSFFENLVMQLCVFVLFGVVFVLFEKRQKNLHRSIETLSINEAIFIGLAQSLAVFPGVSRAGIVLITLMGFKINRKEAAQYSFLLAVPTLFVASAYDLFKSRSILLEQASQNAILLFIGFVTSFVAAIAVIKWFIHFLEKKTLYLFGVYRVVVGGILFLLFFR